MRRWPGNVRELLAEAGNAAHAAVAAGAAAVDVRHLHARAGATIGEDPSRSSSTPPSTARRPSSSQTRQRIVTVLEQSEGNVSAAARELGVHRNQLRRWLDRFGIDPRTFTPEDGE